MTTTRSAKPLVSSLVALAFVLSFVLPFLSYDYLKGPDTPFDPVQAGAIRYGVICFFFILLLGLPLFLKAPPMATQFGSAGSPASFWVSLVIFIGFLKPNSDVLVNLSAA